MNGSSAETYGLALRLLAQREHSRAELERKLLARAHDPDAVAGVLDDLAAQGLQSDERFAEVYVSQRVERGYGPLHIRAELRERGIDDALAVRWLDDADHPWGEILGQALAGRFGSERPSDRKELARQARYLERRGFPADLIRRRLLD